MTIRDPREQIEEYLGLPEDVQEIFDTLREKFGPFEDYRFDEVSKTFRIRLANRIVTLEFVETTDIDEVWDSLSTPSLADAGKMAQLPSREEMIAAIQKRKGDSNCACRPEELKMCMLHIDLDAYVIRKALG